MCSGIDTGYDEYCNIPKGIIISLSDRNISYNWKERYRYVLNDYYDADEILYEMIEKEAIKESQEKTLCSESYKRENKYIITSTQKQKADLSQYRSLHND